MDLLVAVAEWASRSGHLNYHRGQQAPKPAGLHSPQHGPAVEYTREQVLFLGSVVSYLENIPNGRQPGLPAIEPTAAAVLKHLLSSPATYRMCGVSQTLAHPSGIYTNRWNHGVTVGRIAMDVAVKSGFGDPVAAFIGGFVHDIGHPPHHHAAESAYDMVARQYGLEGFNHGPRGRQVVEALMPRHEALDGYAHEFEVSASGIEDYFRMLGLIAGTHSWSLKPADPIESAYVTLGDRIGYVATDLVDCLKSGLVTPGQILDVAPFGAQFIGVDNHPAFRNNRRLNKGQHRSLSVHIARTFTHDAAEQMRNTHLPALSIEAATALDELRNVNSLLVIQRPEHSAWQKSLHEIHVKVAELLVQRELHNLDKEAAVRRALDILVGLTERQFLDLATLKLGGNLAELERTPTSQPQTAAFIQAKRCIRKVRVEGLPKLDDLIAVDLWLPTTDGQHARASLSDAMVVLAVTGARHPHSVIDAQGRRVIDPPRYLRLDPNTRLNPRLRGDDGQIPEMVIATDPERTEQTALFATASKAIVAAIHQAAIEHRSLGPSDATEHHRALRILFDDHKDVRDQILSDNFDLASTLPDIQRLFQAYSIAQRNIVLGPPHTFEGVEIGLVGVGG